MRKRIYAARKDSQTFDVVRLRIVFGDADGRTSSGSFAASKNATEKEQKTGEKFISHWLGRFTKCVVQSPTTEEKRTVTNIYSTTVVCLER